MSVRVGPGHYLRDTGRIETWVARRMGISSSYLSLLLSGKRRWTPALRERFAAAVDRPQSAFDFAQSRTARVRRLRHRGKLAVEATGSHAERVDVSVEYPRTRGPQNGPQEANGDGRTTPDRGGDCHHGVGVVADAPALAEEA